MVTSAETPEVPLHGAASQGLEETVTLTMLHHSPKIHDHNAQEPPGPTPPGAEEADSSSRAVNRQSGSKWRG